MSVQTNPVYQSSLHTNELSSTIDPYYMRGDVFQRDQRYYDQVISTRRNRTPNKSVFPIDANSLSNNIRANSAIVQGNSGFSSFPTNPVQTVNYQPPNQIVINPPPQSQVINVNSAQNQQLRRLRKQHFALTNQLQKLSNGGDFGTGDVVLKKAHYTASKTQNATIRNQEQRIRELQDTVRLNNQKLIKFQKASSELEVRINNIQAIDKEIYKQLKTASTRDKQLLERAHNALLRGEPKQNVLRILQQIVVS